MNKRQVGLLAVVMFLAVELLGASVANAQGRMFSRMRGRLTRTTQCCPAVNSCNTQVATAPVAYGQPVVSESPLGYDQSVAYDQAVMSAGTSNPIIEAPLGNFEPIAMPSEVATVGYVDAIPAVGCNGCGSIQQATYASPISPEPEYFGGDSGISGGCNGCQSNVVQSNVVQGCVSGDCGGGQIVEGQVIEGQVGTTQGYVEGGVVEGQVIEGNIIEGSPLEDAGTAYEGGTLSPSDANSVPEPPAQAPEPAADGKDA